MECWCSSYLSGCLDSFPNTEEDNGEDEEEAEGQLPTDGAQVVQPRRAVDLQHLTATSREVESGCDGGKNQRYEGPGWGGKLGKSRPSTRHGTLHVELLGGRGRRVGPGHVVVSGHVMVAVGRVPAVGAAAPGQRGLEGGQEVVQGPGHDGVVVEGDVERNDANRKTNS